MERDEILEQLTEDILLNGRRCNSNIILRFSNRMDSYHNENCAIDIMSKQNLAAQFSKHLRRCDDKISSVIVCGLIFGKPIFGSIGENFLKSKIKDYRKSGLGVALTKVMLEGLSFDRISVMLNSVEHLLEGNAISTAEEFCACQSFVSLN